MAETAPPKTHGSSSHIHAAAAAASASLRRSTEDFFYSASYFDEGPFAHVSQAGVTYMSGDNAVSMWKRLDTRDFIPWTTGMLLQVRCHLHSMQRDAAVLLSAHASRAWCESGEQRHVKHAPSTPVVPPRAVAQQRGRRVS